MSKMLSLESKKSVHLSLKRNCWNKKKCSLKSKMLTLESKKKGSLNSKMLSLESKKWVHLSLKC